MFREFKIKPLVAAMAAASLLTACGGGGGGDNGSGSGTNLNPGTSSQGGSNPSQGGSTPDQGGGTPNQGGTTPDQNGGGSTPGTPAPDTTMLMTCADGAGVQCSGSTALKTENEVLLTSSGVQVIARSTSDLAVPIVDKTTPTGMALFDQGLADVRVRKDETGKVTASSLLLSGLDMSWDGVKDRPQIIETFSTQPGHTQLSAAGAVVRGDLPAHSDTAFYNFATLGKDATQANYANNIYFPRSDASRCEPAPVPPATCPATETKGIENNQGDWRAEGGRLPDWFGASRIHNDGDIHAGDNVADATGPGVPFPGTKGYRGIDGWSYSYGNLSLWQTQDTVKMAEWTGAAGTDEHNTMRRGAIAFGAVTDPTLVPTAGSSTYTGIVYGYYATSGATDPDVVRGKATVTVDYATRNVTVTFSDVIKYDATGDAVPLLNFSTSATLGAAGSTSANYLSGAVASGTFTGGLSGRAFGPIVSTGASGAGPAEIGGALRFKSGVGGATVIAGFIGRKD
jgi:hypothetical protein